MLTAEDKIEARLLFALRMVMLTDGAYQLMDSCRQREICRDFMMGKLVIVRSSEGDIGPWNIETRL